MESCQLGAQSWLTQVTMSPTWIWRYLGENVKADVISTVYSVALADCPAQTVSTRGSILHGNRNLNQSFFEYCRLLFNSDPRRGTIFIMAFPLILYYCWGSCTPA